MLEDVEPKPSSQQFYRVGERRIGVQGYQGSQSVMIPERRELQRIKKTQQQ